jgi:predicted nucleic acid-binding protein
MIIDTDVLIWFFRGDRNAKVAFEKIVPVERLVSAVTYMELVQGVRNKAELGEIRKIFSDSKFIVVQLNCDTGATACRLLEQFSLQCGLKMADALIAATAIFCKCPVLTGNYKHFRQIGIDVKRFIPSE